jgi:hypothetical protein
MPDLNLAPLERTIAQLKSDDILANQPFNSIN